VLLKKTRQTCAVQKKPPALDATRQEEKRRVSPSRKAGLRSAMAMAMAAIFALSMSPIATLQAQTPVSPVVIPSLKTVQVVGALQPMAQAARACR
jgi:hypothetical protein